MLLAHEDKVFQGALIASMSIPWGETKGDDDVGGYHLVWTRDMVQSATALLASGAIDTPVRALIWLAAIQRSDGSFPQNSWMDVERTGAVCSLTRSPHLFYSLGECIAKGLNVPCSIPG